MFNVPIINLLRDQDNQLQIKLLAGKKGLGKKITIPRIQKPGLALTGDVSNLHPGRIQILGKAEMRYLTSLPDRKQRGVIDKICELDIACFVVTRGIEPPASLIKTCNKCGIPLFTTNLLTSTFVNRATRFLEASLSATTTIHGVLLDVFGAGILIIGKSGVGKSECALDLILRGHRLVADDIVNVRRQAPSSLYGTGSEIIKYHMEIRGLGIINIRDLFGISAVRDRKLIELVVELSEWNPNLEYDRLGLDDQRFSLLDVNIPMIQLPVRPGRNLSAIIEVASRNYLLKVGGHHSAQEFQERLGKEILSAQELKKEDWWELTE